MQMQTNQTNTTLNQTELARQAEELAQQLIEDSLDVQIVQSINQELTKPANTQHQALDLEQELDQYQDYYKSKPNSSWYNQVR